jgi:phage terminase large subunit
LEITLPYQFQPRPYQLPLLQAIDSGKRRAVVVWHRRAGKDKTLINLVAKKAFERIGSYYYFFPTYSQGKKILWDGADKDGFKFLDHFPKELVESKNDTELKVKLKNGSIVQIIGTDNYDSIVGTNPVGCVFSEYALQNPTVWAFIKPILDENGGWAVFNFTPRGKNHGFDIYEFARRTKGWFHQLLTVEDTGVIPKEKLEEIRQEYIEQYGDDSLFQQEYYCSFTAAIQGSYYWKQVDEAERENRFTDVPHDPTSLVHTVWDLGIRDAMAVGFYQRVGFQLRKIDYLEITGEGLPQVIKRLREKPYNYGKHFAPHDIENRELGTGKSRLEVAKELGIGFEIVPNISVQDGIDAGRNIFKFLWVDRTKCKDWVRAIPQYTKVWDDDLKIFKDKPLHDWTSHAADEHRYFALVADQLSNDVDRAAYERVQQARANKSHRE